MRVATISGLSIQIDVPEGLDKACEEDYVRQAVDQINGTLSREPFGLGAQVFVPKKLKFRVKKLDIGEMEPG